MKLKEIHRTSTFAWSPLPALPLLATGTVSGALDESFSNESQLEIWAPDFMNKNEFDLGGEGEGVGPKGSVTNSSRFNRIAWGYVEGNRPSGVIAACMENGELGIWDPAKILENASVEEALIMRNTTHTGPVRGLDFNPIQTSLFSSGAVNGEIYIWDLKDPSKPYSPGTRSSKLNEITSLAWNNQVPHVLATSSSTGYTVVWDLRGKREVTALAYGGGAGTLAGGPQGGLMGGRRGMSDVAWQPDNATRLVTSSEDDASPVVMVWDLRNTRAPEKILTGHEKGVLSLSWCKQDPDLLLSAGKDNRALCWNPQTSEIIGELPTADNWAFQVQWCPRNPDLFAAAFFDGTIGIHSVQSTNEPAVDVQAPTPAPDGADIFDVPSISRMTQGTLSLKQPPKWLRRPVSSSFGYGGKLVSVSNLQSKDGSNQSSVVHVRTVVTEPGITERAQKLRSAIDGQALNSFADHKSQMAEQDAESSVTWKALSSLFRANSRDELVTLLGFSKEEIAVRVAEAVAKLKKEADSATETPRSPLESYTSETKSRSVVSFAEPEKSPSEAGGEDAADDAAGNQEATPSEVSGSAASENTDATPAVDAESTTTTVPSLFGDDNGAGTPQMDAAADFFSSMGMSQNQGDQMTVPHTNYALDSSVAATIGSGPSSVASESLKSNTFRIYPNDESETDQLITKALVLGDFESAVSLCLSSDRFADAILLAVKGGTELLQRTQKIYFERCTTSSPYLRLFQSIVTNDLADIVQNADLREWQEIFVVICTFANSEEFPALAEQLGQRLEFQSHLAAGSDSPDAAQRAREFRKNATLTYLAAGRLERLVNIWIEELVEEELRLASGEDSLDGSRYTAHAHALQSFVEKVTVFRSASNYVDTDLTGSSEDTSAMSYKLSALYDRYFEYADLLAAQGLVKGAVSFMKLTPPEYSGSSGSAWDFETGKERLLAAVNETAPVAGSSKIAAPAAPAVPTASSVSSTSSYPYGQYQQPAQPTPPVITQSSPYSTYGPAATQSTPYAPAPAPAPAQTSFQQPYQQQQAYQQHQPYQQQQPYQQSAAPSPYSNTSGKYVPHLQNQPSPQGPSPGMVPPPRANGGPPGAATLPPPPKRANGGWNDAPMVSERRTPNPLNINKPAPIVSPFPNAAPSPLPQTPGSPFQGQQQPNLPPPPRSGSRQANGPPHPPQAGQRLPPGGGPGPYPPHGRPGSIPPPGAPPQNMAPPPQRMMSPPQMQGSAGHPPSQFAQPPPRGHMPPSNMNQPPQGPYARGTPPPIQQVNNPYIRATPSPSQVAAPGPYARTMSPQAQSGPYAPPPSGARPGPPGQHMQGPPPHAGPPPAGPPPAGPPHPGPPHAGPPPSGPSAPQGPPGVRSPAPPAKKEPAGPKYPPGDRSHIPDTARPIYNVLSEQLARLKQTMPPQQKRVADDLDRRINGLFDALNCETLSRPVVDQLLDLTSAMAAHDREAALTIHMDLLTRGALTDDIGLWMSAVKQLIMRL
ncbi:hypothetical protein GLOTRDRAFT_122261 [Gloeophyllum trabeum ATCC 11539]|uniref:Protein transport protein SEC31 n=1 Tax=Gloeophyllum trabeum (strain ATCC 11539 / FP-39264 / Madison 617) TaxID=670483 RepID=S7RM11_GLOTA|nr:uncharacterized protein GLOTRDRAFT_122261 [Gloeophyllum trabeum ATCC 11539]EPQ53749.1 hypothetical protein GLOTRDRAFT_122261 [Gloeophyllum trabeum ATCC 11539]